MGSSSKTNESLVRRKPRRKAGNRKTAAKADPNPASATIASLRVTYGHPPPVGKIPRWADPRLVDIFAPVAGDHYVDGIGP